ncbi:MAG TPA: hypothetical protein VGI39_19220 [Polyangiaceae bacterium]
MFTPAHSIRRRRGAVYTGGRRVRATRGAVYTSRALLAFLVFVIGTLAACVRTEPVAPATAGTLTSAPAPTDYASLLLRARSARDRALGMRAPMAADFESLPEEATLAVLQKWSIARRDASQDAHRAYGEALVAAAQPADQAVVYAELADLWLRLDEDARTALFAAAPATFRDDPALVTSVDAASGYALQPLLDRIAGLLAACRRVAPADSGAFSDAITCASVARRFVAADDPRGPNAARVSQAVASTELRPIVPTTHPQPCTFKGTLAARGTVYADEAGSEVVLSVRRDDPIEVELLAVPKARGGRYKVSVSWPKQVEGYLQAEDAPLVLLRRVDQAKDRVWATEGDAVAASDARGPTVEVTRASHGSGGASERRLFCHDLELATPPRGARASGLVSLAGDAAEARRR